MGVYIKGMDMPTNCADCKVRIATGCCGNLPYNMRMPNCPLVEVPKHGRLIDADAFEKYCDQKWIPLNVDALHGAPTVIEGE